MNWPTFPAMVALAAIDQGKTFVLAANGMAIEFETPSGHCGQIAVGDEIDELISRAWVEQNAEAVWITEKGRYWLRRYKWPKK